MRWRASSYADTDSDRATESYAIRNEYPYFDGHTDRYTGAVNADAVNTSGSNVNGDAHANRVSDTDRDTSARIA